MFAFEDENYIEYPAIAWGREHDEWQAKLTGASVCRQINA